MAFFREREVLVADSGYPVRQKMRGFTHWHGDSIEPHRHLVGEMSRFIEWRHDVLRMKAEHIHPGG